MTSSPSRASANSSSPTPTRSLLSRLKSPLSTKARNNVEFYIQSDDPHRQYTPGDIISGTVILKVIKPLRITHLVVSLHGYAQVFKNPNTPGDAYKNYSATIGSGKGKKGGSYFGNGFASLFEDEVVLCGEGRLAEGVYHFNFELEFPSKGLPSSIEFERGTVSYMLTSTLTRPTTIAPITSCEAKIHLSDAIDIAPIAQPKPRIISLEPISRRARARNPRKPQDPPVSDTPPQTAPSAPHDAAEAVHRPRTSASTSIPEDKDTVRSPSPSDVSFESKTSSGNASGTEYGIRSVHTAQDGSNVEVGGQKDSKGRTITATIHVLKGGFLRGDQIPIRVTVNHTKHVRSLKGIIVTLYRQARVDMHPALPVVPNSRGDKNKTEDYYPKSRTGLGGLSLSSAGSSHVFRKDLSQSFAPLFVDPRTLTAEIKCAVRVPDEAFPTMSNVPGAMISFRYYVEVVVDIQGKLTGLDRMVANAGLVNVPSAGGTGAGGDDSTGGTFSTWGGNFVDTDQIRREKGVISALFEVIIGTKDSDRNGKRKQTQPYEDHNIVREIPFTSDGSLDHTEDYNQNYYDYDENGQYYDYGYDASYYDAPGYDQYGTGQESSREAYLQPPAAEQGVSEKEQLRRAEARLLPSQPPDISSQSSRRVPQGIVPSAPVLAEEDYAHPSYHQAASSSSLSSRAAQPPPAFHASSSLSPVSMNRSTGPGIPDSTNGIHRTATNDSSRTIHISNFNPTTQNVPPNATEDDPSKPLPPIPLQPRVLDAATPNSQPAPEYFPSASSHVAHTDDKQELQRRRLEMERSAPPGIHDNDNENDMNHDNDSSPYSRSRSQRPPVPLAKGMQALSLAPSAPVLDDDDEGLVDAMRGARNGPSVPGGGSSSGSGVGNARGRGSGSSRGAWHEHADGRRVSEALPEYRI